MKQDKGRSSGLGLDQRHCLTFTSPWKYKAKTGQKAAGGACTIVGLGSSAGSLEA
jgi:hypothetical protein